MLGPWKGPQATEHVRIPDRRGNLRRGRVERRDRDRGRRGADARYIACFISTRAEIVVPVIYDGVVVAEIDVDSDAPAAFGSPDREFLEQVAAMISPHCLVGWDTGGMDWDAPENWT